MRKSNYEPSTYKWNRIYSTVYTNVFSDNTLLEKLIQRAELCAEHNMVYVLSGNKYRKYRRGKNRCINCGVKIK